MMKQKLLLPLLTAALLLGAFQPQVWAQASDSAFVSLCSGDVSTWMRIPMRQWTLAYSPPSMVSSTVHRDTVIDGRQYVYLLFPPEMALPEGWMRSDPAGLYLRGSDSDTLLLPADVKLNDLLLNGKVFEILTVPTQFGQLPAYRISRTVFPGKRIEWTWVPVIGLWECSISQGDLRVQYHYLSGLRCGRGTPDLPVALDVPLRSGDILVHEIRQKATSETAYRVQSSSENLEGTRWIHSEPTGDGEYTVRHLKVSINTDGHVLHDALDMLGSDPDVEPYPAYIPALDTVLLGGRPYAVIARFDTTIFSDTVSACRLRSADQLAPRTILYADRFGLVHEETDAITATLHSAVIWGNKYNRQAVVRRWLPLCDGSVYEYRMTGPFSDTYGRMKLRDSTLLGRTSVFFEPPGMAVMGMSSMRYPLRGLMTEQAEGVRRSNGGMLIPFAAELGDTTSTGMVISLEQRQIFGTSRRVMLTAKVSDDINRRDLYVEDVGMYSSDIQERGFGRFTWTLTGAIVCGESIGTPLSADRQLPFAAAADMMLYPNPTTTGTRAIVSMSILRHGHYQLAVSDVLGRILFRSEMYLPKGTTSVPLPLDGFAPGAYMVVLLGDDVVKSTALFISR